MKYTVLLPEPIAEAGEQYLREHGYEIRQSSGITTEILKKEVEGCHAILVRTAKLTEEVLDAGKDLQVIARHGVGVDNIDVDAATRLGIQVTNAPESNTNSVAEHTIGLIIAIVRSFVRSDQELRSGNFAFRNQFEGIELEGKVLGIIGVGRIGSLVAVKAVAGLGMQAIGFDPYADSAGISDIEMLDALEDLLKAADIVTLHLPATGESMGLIGERELAMMKPTSYLINAARGGLVKEDDLARALAEKTIAGAALDVFADEPPDSKDQLFKAQNLIVSPHSAALTKEAKDRMALHAAWGIHEVLSGKKPRWPVNNPT